MTILLGLAIGVILGALGGGGAILTVPALVYLLGQNAQDAIASSLVIVGVTATFGTLSYLRAGDVHWRIGTIFGVTGIAATYGGTLVNRHVDQHILLIGFAGVMTVAAIGMLVRGEAPSAASSRQDYDHDDSRSAPMRSATSSPVDTLTAAERPATGTSLKKRRVFSPRVLLAGLSVGFLTGFFGVGGGFLIVPVLVVVLGLPMPAAVGTSLLIIAINSATALGARVTTADFDWAIVIPFTLAAVVATVAGKRIADRLPDRSLNTAFAVLLLCVAAYTGIHSAVQFLGGT